MRESFVFYRSFYDAIKDLPRDVQGEIYTAIMEYSLYGKETENLKPIARSVFTLMKPQIDVNNKRFENGKKGAEHGSKGGRPRKEETPRKPQNNPEETPIKPQENPKETPNVNDNVNANENKDNTTDVVSKKDAAKAATLKRKDEFGKSLVPFVDKYGKEMIRAFFEYWSELNKSETKMLCEMQKTWEVSKRLATWAGREKTRRPNTDVGTVLHDNSQSKYDEKLW